MKLSELSTSTPPSSPTVTLIEARSELPSNLHLQSAQSAYGYARKINHRYPEGEPLIATDPKFAVLYAERIIKGRWRMGEKIIATDPRSLKRAFSKR